MYIKPIEYTNGRFYPSFTLDEEWEVMLDLKNKKVFTVLTNDSTN